MGDINKLDELNIQAYQAARTQLIEAEQNQVNMLDKAILTISTGVFGISITFIEKIAGENPTNTWALIVSWSLFVLTIISTLFSFRASQKALRVARDLLDEQYGNNVKPKDQENRKNKCVAFFNFISIWAVSLGIGFLAAFALLNL